MIYHPDMNGGDKSKTEKFKLITSSFEILCKEVENRRHFESSFSSDHSSKAQHAYSNGPQVRVRRRGARKPVSSEHYNVNAWQQAHFGRSATHLDSDLIRNHPSIRPEIKTSEKAGINEGFNTSYGFMKGMDSNKTFKYSQKLNRKDDVD